MALYRTLLRKPSKATGYGLYTIIPVFILMAILSFYMFTNIKLFPTIPDDPEEAQLAVKLERIKRFGLSFPSPREPRLTGGPTTDDWWPLREAEERTNFDWLRTQWMLSLSV